MSDYNPVENPWKWASENLSKPRAQAFWRAYQELLSGKTTPEHSKLWRELQDIENAFYSKLSPEISAIYQQEQAEVSELEKQIRELQDKVADIRKQANDRVVSLRMGVYSDPAYKAKREQVGHSAKIEQDIFRPKLQALVDKYAAAQLASDTKSA